MPADIDSKRKPSPHIHGRGIPWGPVRDYNGVGPWSEESIRDRYERYAAEMHVVHPAQLAARRHSAGEILWIYPLLDEIIPLIEAGDPAAATIGLEFIEEDDFFHFGAILKSKIARALRRFPLDEAQKERIRKRIVSMMLAGNVPHEFQEYRRLLSKIGLGSLESKLDAEVDRANPHVMRHYVALKKHQPGGAS